jgi:hypothetical protein
MRRQSEIAVMTPNLSENESAVIRALADAGGTQNWMTAPEIAKRSAEQGDGLSAPNIRNVLLRMHNHVEYRTKNGVKRFHLKRAAQSVLGTNSANASAFISPGTPWSSKQAIRSFLANHATGNLLLIDPYVAEETLDVLADVNVPIQILAAKLGRGGNEDNFARTFKHFKREKKGQVDLRKISRDELHGRYIFTDHRGWVIDHSLQDIGSKPALIMPLHLDNVFSEVRSYFSRLFDRGNIVNLF